MMGSYEVHSEFKQSSAMFKVKWPRLRPTAYKSGDDFQSEVAACMYKPTSGIKWTPIASTRKHLTSLSKIRPVEFWYSCGDQLVYWWNLLSIDGMMNIILYQCVHMQQSGQKINTVTS